MRTLKVDIYLSENNHRRNKHKRDNQIRLTLRGEAAGKAKFADFDTFAKFIKGCQDFISTYTPIPEAFLDAFDDQGRPVRRRLILGVGIR